MSGDPRVALPFEDAAQQRDAATLGMWLFLATEVLFFGALFLTYTIYRISYPHDFQVASNHTLLPLGALNTAILLTSSLTMAIAVRHSEVEQTKATSRMLLLTAILGGLFLVIKGFEYHHEIGEGLLPGRSFHFENAPRAELFFYLYFVITGLHALHVLIGVCLIVLFAARVRSSVQPSSWKTPVELLGIYWHFVDIVWVFVFPLLYLQSRNQ